jgi:hypothetical protein
MVHFFSIVLFGLLLASVGSVCLALIPTFRPDRKRFDDRFLFFLGRYFLPAWAFQEVLFRVVFGVFFP